MSLSLSGASARAKDVVERILSGGLDVDIDTGGNDIDSSGGSWNLKREDDVRLRFRSGETRFSSPRVEFPSTARPQSMSDGDTDLGDSDQQWGTTYTQGIDGDIVSEEVTDLEGDNLSISGGTLGLADIIDIDELDGSGGLVDRAENIDHLSGNVFVQDSEPADADSEADDIWIDTS